MKKDDIIKLSNRETATIVKGDESVYQKIYIVKTEDGRTRVVDKETNSVVPTNYI